jgi:hypothetical protein
MKINNIFLFLFIVIFPFGQIIRMGILHPIDLVVGIAALYSIFYKLPKPGWFMHLARILFVAVASWLFSIFLFQDLKVIYGLLYLLRLLSYLYFSVYVWNLLKTESDKKIMINALLTVSIVSAVIGWVQFIVFPDLKPLFILGWDMHLFRIVGSFLDPGFMGLIIVFGLLIAINNWLEARQKKYLFISLFLLISLAFTYSRASFLAFLTGLTFIAIQKRAFKKLVFFALGLIFVALILPTSKNKSIELFRSFSIVARVENYKETISVFTNSPVFGVGYNNMCLAYNKFVRVVNSSSHSCSGSDSSILFVLATTGAAGLMIFIFSINAIYKELPVSKYKKLLMVLFTALLIHSLFSNSVFYPWILGYMMVALSVAS